MTINEEMYNEFSNVVIGEDSISNDALLQVLKDYAGFKTAIKRKLMEFMPNTF